MEEIRDLLVQYYAYKVNDGLIGRLMSFTMIPNEAMFLYTLILREKFDAVFECGTAVGWSSSWMALAMGDKPVITFDIEDRPKLFTVKGRNVRRILGKFDENVAEHIGRYGSGKNLYMIDGCHKGRSVVQDFHAIRPHLKKNDVIVFHDARMEGIRYAVDAVIKPKYSDWKYEFIDTNYGLELVTVL